MGGLQAHPGENQVGQGEGEGDHPAGGPCEGQAPGGQQEPGGPLQHRVPHRSLLHPQRRGHHTLETHSHRQRAR